MDSDRPALRMIIDPKSAQFITWTELGTSFVVSNVAEFSRTILGSHFKHNNVSETFVCKLDSDQMLSSPVPPTLERPPVLQFRQATEYVRFP